jgi:hypothetical protein
MERAEPHRKIMDFDFRNVNLATEVLTMEIPWEIPQNIKIFKFYFKCYTFVVLNNYYKYSS